MEEKTAKDIREEWVKRAEVLLGVGKGHMGIISFLRSKGLGPDEAKKVSYDIFDEAKRRLMRSQRGYRIGAWVFIVGGVVVLGAHVFGLLKGFGLAVFLIIGGVLILGKIVSPDRLPE